MEERIQKLVQLLEKNSTWRWLGYNTLLGDGSTNQYAGLKIFIKYVLENRTSLIDQREDRGVNFTSTGNNSICRDFVKYLQKKAEETGDEREKAQLLLMANRAEAMMQMQDPSLGQMNDGIFLAHAFTFVALGEKGNPPVEVTQDSIVGLLENGLTQSRKEKPELSNVIDFAEGKTKELAMPVSGAGVGGEPSGITLKPALEQQSTTYSTAGGGTSYAPGSSVPTETPPTGTPPTQTPPKEKGEAPKAATKEPKEADLKADIDEEPLFQTPGTAEGKSVVGKRAVKRGVTEGQTKGSTKGKVKVPEGTKIQRPVIAAGGQRKKVSKKRQIKQAKDQARERERQREPQAPAQQPTQGQAGRRQPISSGGWKIAKRAGKIMAGGGTGAGILGWAVSSGNDAAASTFAFIHTLF
ncbi:MAG: hypothetical protein ABID64_01945 [Nitrospirota bacterium]